MYRSTTANQLTTIIYHFSFFVDILLLTGLSSNHTVIAFDQRGIGNTTAGSKPYTMLQLANDTAGLLDALKIPNADVMGYSLGSYLAQQLTMMYPEKVNRLVQ